MNLELFPTSESAKRMMSYLTQNGWYDKSYVGKWLFQVMGIEMDEARKYVEELRLQAFPETATWGLMYHEMKYGLPVRDNLPDEERRRIIIRHRDTAEPASPWRMERLIRNVADAAVHVTDINDGAPVDHPNMFIVEVEDPDGIDVGAVIAKIKAVKQSHTTFAVYFGCEIGIRIHASTAPTFVISPMCGTLPDTSTGGVIGRPTLRLGVSPSPWSVNNLFPGQNVETGEEPVLSTGLSGNPRGIEMGVAGAAYMSECRMCGEEW